MPIVKKQKRKKRPKKVVSLLPGMKLNKERVVEQIKKNKALPPASPTFQNKASIKTAQELAAAKLFRFRSVGVIIDDAIMTPMSAGMRALAYNTGKIVAAGTFAVYVKSEKIKERIGGGATFTTIEVDRHWFLVNAGLYSIHRLDLLEPLTAPTSESSLDQQQEPPKS